MKRFAPTAVVLALLILMGWFAVPKANRPGPAPDNDEAPIALPDTPEGDCARRLIEASLKHGGEFPQPSKLLIVVGKIARVDGATVDFADKAGLTACRVGFLKGPTGLQPGEVDGPACRLRLAY